LIIGVCDEGLVAILYQGIDVVFLRAMHQLMWGLAACSHIFLDGLPGRLALVCEVIFWP